MSCLRCFFAPIITIFPSKSPQDWTYNLRPIDFCRKKGRNRINFHHFWVNYKGKSIVSSGKQQFMENGRTLYPNPELFYSFKNKCPIIFKWKKPAPLTAQTAKPELLSHQWACVRFYIRIRLCPPLPVPYTRGRHLSLQVDFVRDYTAN